jgi:deoxyribodipyrimidine photolyase-related protein
MEVALVYPHQLYAKHPALAEGRRTYLIEDPLFFGNDRHWPLAVHKQRLVLHRASMKAWAEGKEDLHYVEASENLLETGLPQTVKRVVVVDPVDDVLMRRIRRFAEGRGIELEVIASPNFLSDPELLEKHTGPERKQPFMASFYKEQRQALGILVNADGSPKGGRWSYDEENRQRFPEDHLAPGEPGLKPNEAVAEAITYVEKHFPDNPGGTARFGYPVTRRQALAWLDRFIAERLADFGAYEDAISRNHRVLFHSVMTPALNIGLVGPEEMVERALAKAAEVKVPLNSLEGFVRQVIGWREFMAGI